MSGSFFLMAHFEQRCERSDWGTPMACPYEWAAQRKREVTNWGAGASNEETEHGVNKIVKGPEDELIPRGAEGMMRN